MGGNRVGRPNSAEWAAILFLAQRGRWRKALAVHAPDSRAWCVNHGTRWPCLTWLLAVRARDLAEPPEVFIPSPRTPMRRDFPVG